jgi:hypothetical protein
MDVVTSPQSTTWQEARLTFASQAKTLSCIFGMTLGP